MEQKTKRTTVTPERVALVTLADALDQLAKSVEKLHERVLALERHKDNVIKV